MYSVNNISNNQLNKTSVYVKCELQLICYILGWFYHAPARPALNEPMGVPPPSQIPGLSGVEDGPPPMETPVRNRILETDSKYVQLAKRGGREDLLQFKYLGKPSEQAQSYPRVDWYYLEDIRQEEAEKHRQEEEENR